MSSIKGTNYTHDWYQAYVTACGAAQDKKFTLVVLPTSCGKSFVMGLYYQYYGVLKDKSVAAVVPN